MPNIAQGNFSPKVNVQSPKPKVFRNTECGMGFPGGHAEDWRLTFSTFGIRISFGFRASVFGFSPAEEAIPTPLNLRPEQNTTRHSSSFVYTMCPCVKIT